MSPATPIITLGAPLIELSSIDSTNIYAISQIKQQMAVTGSCYRAQYQTQGKGQQGRVWTSEKGENLLCSYVLSLNDIQKGYKKEANWEPDDQIGLSFAVSLGVWDFFSKLAGDETRIKWPNDLYWRDRKAGGILIENTVRGNIWSWSVIGIGININQTNFDADIVQPVSLKQITGKNWDISVLLHALSAALTKRVNTWLQVGGEGLLKEYNECMYKKDQAMKFTYEGKTINGIIKSVNEKGQLILDQGAEQTYNFGDLKWER